MPRERAVKLKDIADAAGVAVATVSAALNGTGTVSNRMRERVRKVAAEMNYEPNMAATNASLYPSTAAESASPSGALRM